MPDVTMIDPLRRRIVLHDRTWHGHICKGHPEMRQHRDRVVEVVRSPTEIRFSRSDVDCRIYYGSGPRRLIEVAVVADVIQGIVKTAYLTKKRSAGEVEWATSTPTL